jgi:hypothetical protein
MAASAVVEPFDVADDLPAGLGLGGVDGAVDEFVFQGREEGLRERVDAPIAVNCQFRLIDELVRLGGRCLPGRACCPAGSMSVGGFYIQVDTAV